MLKSCVLSGLCKAKVTWTIQVRKHIQTVSIIASASQLLSFSMLKRMINQNIIVFL